MWHKPCRTFNPWCLCIKTRCLSLMFFAIVDPYTLQWRHYERDGVSNHQPHDCLLNCLFSHRSKKTSKLCVTGLCVWNSLVTGEFPAQMASDAENVSIWWRHHDTSQNQFWSCTRTRVPAIAAWATCPIEIRTEFNHYTSGLSKYVNENTQATVRHWCHVIFTFAKHKH